MKKNTIKNIPAEKIQQLKNYRYAVKRCEDKGLYDTAHHEMLKRLEAELGLITNQKETRVTTDEVKDNGE